MCLPPPVQLHCTTMRAIGKHSKKSTSTPKGKGKKQSAQELPEVISAEPSPINDDGEPKLKKVQKHYTEKTCPTGGADKVSKAFKDALKGEKWIPVCVALPNKGMPPNKPTGSGGYSSG